MRLIHGAALRRQDARSPPHQRSLYQRTGSVDLGLYANDERCWLATRTGKRAGRLLRRDREIGRRRGSPIYPDGIISDEPPTHAGVNPSLHLIQPQKPPASAFRCQAGRAWGPGPAHGFRLRAEVASSPLTVNLTPGLRQQTVDQIWPARRNSFPRHRQRSSICSERASTCSM
jgi:hypothetical protein